MHIYFYQTQKSRLMKKKIQTRNDENGNFQKLSRNKFNDK